MGRSDERVMVDDGCGVPVRVTLPGTENVF
jgi:hypothetical protein